MKYNVGDRVRIKSLDWYNENKDEDGNIDISHDFTFYADRSKYCGKVFTIVEVFDNCYAVKEDNNEYYWSDEMIEGLVEEETYNFLKTDKPYPSSEDRLDNIQFVVYNELKLPDGYIFKDENGNVINAQKIVLEKKKKEYPKTYEECCKVMGVNHTNDLDICEHCDYKTEITYYEDNLLEKIETLYRLIICRDAYWKIAGEEMGLGKLWEPDWNIRGYYGIARSYGNVIKTSNYNCDLTFVFPTEEMRDAFKNNFDPDIEFCKEFL